MSAYRKRIYASIVGVMPDNRTSRNERRRDWDATYRDKHRERRRAYDRERMRRLRADADGDQ